MLSSICKLGNFKLNTASMKITKCFKLIYVFWINVVFLWLIYPSNTELGAPDFVLACSVIARWNCSRKRMIVLVTLLIYVHFYRNPHHTQYMFTYEQIYYHLLSIF